MKFVYFRHKPYRVTSIIRWKCENTHISVTQCIFWIMWCFCKTGNLTFLLIYMEKNCSFIYHIGEFRHTGGFHYDSKMHYKIHHIENLHIKNKFLTHTVVGYWMNFSNPFFIIFFVRCHTEQVYFFLFSYSLSNPTI